MNQMTKFLGEVADVREYNLPFWIEMTAPVIREIRLLVEQNKQVDEIGFKIDPISGNRIHMFEDCTTYEEELPRNINKFQGVRIKGQNRKNKSGKPCPVCNEELYYTRLRIKLYCVNCRDYYEIEE